MLGVVGTRLTQARHLARRFFASLSDERPEVTDDQWIRSNLLPGEEDLWAQMSAPDQRHALQVARDVAVEIPQTQRPIIAAAVMHDVGKLVCGYGTWARVLATVFWGVVPAALRGRLAFGWADRKGLGRLGPMRRLGEYRIHPELGRDLLVAAGSESITAAWAAEHHTPPERWTVDAEVGMVLKECDDD